MGHEILEKVKKDMDDKKKKVDESFHLYRQSGLGVDVYKRQTLSFHDAPRCYNDNRNTSSRRSFSFCR